MLTVIRTVWASGRFQVCMLLQETVAHKLWLKAHGLLLGLHVGSHFVLNKAMPSVFAEPSLLRMLKGEIPYRQVLQSMYRDGVIFAAVCAVAAAGTAYKVTTASAFTHTLVAT